jgi:hypothetical protein
MYLRKQDLTVTYRCIIVAVMFHITQVERLTYWVRTLLNDTAHRAMACLEPIKVTITNLDTPLLLVAPLLPMAPEKVSASIDAA